MSLLRFVVNSCFYFIILTSKSFILAAILQVILVFTFCYLFMYPLPVRIHIHLGQVVTYGPFWPLLSMHVVLCMSTVVQTFRNMCEFIKASYNCFIYWISLLIFWLVWQFLSCSIQYINRLPAMLDFPNFLHWGYYCYYFRQHFWAWDFLSSVLNLAANLLVSTVCPTLVEQSCWKSWCELW